MKWSENCMNLKPTAKQGPHTSTKLFRFIQLKDFPPKNQYMHFVKQHSYMHLNFKTY